MPFEYHIAGPVSPLVRMTPRVSGAFQSLGLCEDGADVELQVMTRDVKADGSGGSDGPEVDSIFLGAVAVVKFTLVPYDEDVAGRMRRLAFANVDTSPAPYDGVFPLPGTMYGQAGALVWLYLPSSDGEGPWSFPACRVVKAGTVRQGVKEHRPQWEFRSIPFYVSASSTKTVGTPAYPQSTLGLGVYRRTVPT